MPKSEIRRLIWTGNLPMRIPIWQTLLVWVALDHFRAPAWLWGGAALFLILLWAAWIHQVSTRDSVDVLSNRK
jgi:hypothetical protein